MFEGGFLTGWPVLKQIKSGSLRGTGEEAMSARTLNLVPKNHDAEVARSVCPYCGVGCGQIIFHKGADTFQLHTHPGRLRKVRYRAPFSREWTELDLEKAMDMVADRVWDTRERTFVEKQDGAYVNHTLGIAHLGGATLDNEENYLMKKLFAAGLGMNCISNQARI